MIFCDLPDLNPAENPVACVPPDDYRVTNTSDLDTIRREDSMPRRRESSAVDRGTMLLLDDVGDPLKFVGAAEESTNG